MRLDNVWYAIYQQNYSTIPCNYLVVTETNGKNRYHLHIHKNYKTKFNKMI